MSDFNALSKEENERWHKEPVWKSVLKNQDEEKKPFPTMEEFKAGLIRARRRRQAMYKIDAIKTVKPFKEEL